MEKMEKIHKFRIGNFIKINFIKYKIIDISVIKMGKCFRDHYGNSFKFKLLDDNNNETNIIFNGKNIRDYIIDENT